MSKTALVIDAAGALHQASYKSAVALFARDAAYATQLRAAGFVSVALVHDFENVSLNDPSFLPQKRTRSVAKKRKRA